MLAALFDRPAAEWLWPVLRPRLPRLACLFVLGLAAAGLALVPPWLTKLVIDEGPVAPDPALAWPARPRPLPPGRGALAFEGLRVEQGGRVLFDGLSATIPAGAKVRVAGPAVRGASAAAGHLAGHLARLIGGDVGVAAAAVVALEAGATFRGPERRLA